MKKIKTVFENEHFLIAAKPSAMLSVPSRLGDRETRPILKRLLENQLKIKLWAVHRLDFEVSGLILYAKSPVSHRQANQWFEDQRIKKSYRALTEGDFVAAEGFKIQSEWKSYLFRGKKRTFEAPYGQLAITHAQYLQVVEQNNKRSLDWLLLPQTGRGHQLRYELSKRQFAILGDFLYGAHTEYGENTIALESVAMFFTNCPDYEKFGLPEKIELPASWE